MNNSRKRGFTLIELLVVIAIIAILAAILFPVFAKARERAKTTTCLNNEKQIGIALSSYAQDYDERYPPTRLTAPYQIGDKTWKDAILPLIGNSKDVFRCPSNDYYNAKGGSYPTAGDESGRFPRSYATNGAVFPNDNTSIQLSKFKNPSGTILICESRYPDSNQYSNGATLPWKIMNGQWFKKSDPDKGAFQTHGNGLSNFIFADTHVKAMRVTQTYTPQQMWELDQTSTTLQKQYDGWAAQAQLLKEYQ